MKAIMVAYSFTERIVPTIAQTAKNPNPNAACVISTVIVALFISANVRQTVANPSQGTREPLLNLLFRIHGTGQEITNTSGPNDLFGESGKSSTVFSGR
ncbi:MAG: hypothetical protein ACO1RA_09870 [Planctomycetaceae bacterium]